jgi:hypothetical protein
MILHEITLNSKSQWSLKCVKVENFQFSRPMTYFLSTRSVLPPMCFHIPCLYASILAYPHAPWPHVSCSHALHTPCSHSNVLPDVAYSLSMFSMAAPCPAPNLLTCSKSPYSQTPFPVPIPSRSCGEDYMEGSNNQRLYSPLICQG